MYTVRMFVPKRLGRAELYLHNPGITDASVVHISVSPVVQVWNLFFRDWASGDVVVGRISPGSGYVRFVVNVSGLYPIDLMADISIFDPPSGQLVIGT